MIECPKCGSRNGQVLSSMGTLLSFKPVVIDGVLHNHNPNEFTQQILCEAKHLYERRYKLGCELCGKPPHEVSDARFIR